MTHASVQIIRDEHAALAAMLRSLVLMVERGPLDAVDQYFDVLRAMLFYIYEFPERLHHPKETELLFPKVARAAAHTREMIAKLDQDHHRGENAVRQLQHQLLAWELLGDSRRAAFESANWASRTAARMCAGVMVCVLSANAASRALSARMLSLLVRPRDARASRPMCASANKAGPL